MTEQEIRAAHPDWSDEQVAAELAKQPQEPAADPETVTLTKAEVDALRRQAAEGSKAQRKSEAEKKKAEEERQAEEGKWKELAEQKDRELAQIREESDRTKREQRITRIATRMKFLDPADVTGRIGKEDGEDDSLIEAALERIAKQSPHLVANETAVPPEIGRVLDPSAVTAPTDGKPKPPAGKAPLTSLDDVRKLTEAEINDRWDEVQAVMASG